MVCCLHDQLLAAHSSNTWHSRVQYSSTGIPTEYGWGGGRNQAAVMGERRRARVAIPVGRL